MRLEQTSGMISKVALRWFFLVLGVGLTAGSSFAFSWDRSYEVSEVLKVKSLSEFECRIKNYPYSKHARFRVKIRDVIVNSQVPKDDALEYLSERLKKAEHITLENIQPLNYFRLIADIRVDDRDLCAELIQQHLALPKTQPKEQEIDTDRPQRYVSRSASGTQTTMLDKSSVPRIRRRFVTLQSLLDAVVDVSALNEETSVEEALDILAGSVRPRLPFVVLWNDLTSNAMLDRDTPIGVGGFGKMKLKKAIEMVLHSLSSRAPTKLILAVEGQVITVGTRNGLLQKSRVRTYSMEDLISIPADADEDSVLDFFDGRSSGNRR